MEASDIWQLLNRGGLALSAGDPGTDFARGPAAGRQLSKYNGLADPSGAEELGQLLAEGARNLEPSVVLLWEHPQDVVLGHVIGRELGVPALRSYDQDGLVGLAGALPEGCRVLLVSDAFREPNVVLAMSSMVESYGGRVVGAAALVETEALHVAGDHIPRKVTLVSAGGDSSL